MGDAGEGRDSIMMLGIQRSLSPASPWVGGGGGEGWSHVTVQTNMFMNNDSFFLFSATRYELHP